MDDKFEIFLGTVTKVYVNGEDFKELKTEGSGSEYTIYYNDNKSINKKDVRFLGAIDFIRNRSIAVENYAFPFDKNNFTYPIKGETVFIIKNLDEYYYLPYTVTQYPNYREDFKTTNATKEREQSVSTTKPKKDYGEVSNTGTPNVRPNQKESEKKKYKVNEKIKFLKPKEGDTILSGRVGNTIRFSEFFLAEDNKTSSAGIFIRNRQNSELDSKPIGELIEEDINKDGSSIYIVSNKIKVPFKETIKKEKVGFKSFPTSKDLTGDQLFINSDRILLSSKAKEFIIFGKGNTGIITDGNFSVDAKNEIYLHNENNITIHSKGSNKIFLNSDSGGKIYLGKDEGEGGAGSPVQKMVLGGELVQILSKLLDEIIAMTVATPCGPSSPPVNAPNFAAIKARLNTILSAKNFLSKS